MGDLSRKNFGDSRSQPENRARVRRRAACFEDRGEPEVRDAVSQAMFRAGDRIIVKADADPVFHPGWSGKVIALLPPEDVEKNPTVFGHTPTGHVYLVQVRKHPQHRIIPVGERDLELTGEPDYP